jgi:hypothetical protein
LLITGLFWEKSTAGWWLISQMNKVRKRDLLLQRQERGTTTQIVAACCPCPAQQQSSVCLVGTKNEFF